MRLTALKHKLDVVDRKLDQKIDTLDKSLSEKVDLTRDLILAEIKAMKAQADVNIAKLTYLLDLDRRVSKIESERASEQKEPAPQRIAQTY